MFLISFFVKYFFSYEPEIICQPRWLVISKNILPFFLVTLLYFPDFYEENSFTLIGMACYIFQLTITSFIFGVIIWLTIASFIMIFTSLILRYNAEKLFVYSQLFTIRLNKFYWSVFQGLGFWLICCLMGLALV